MSALYLWQCAVSTIGTWGPHLREELLFDSVHELGAEVARMQHDFMVQGDVVEHPGRPLLV